ncbi:Acetyltransferase (GNAT) domain-containing protein [Streptomyces sp. DvalAA-14]|uniref:GNAT family N-acetyltransferase n=1 Tax=unclassified Streptomyces TaxID=2593676 RepID=UPI00081B0864|nr:MULTISPECIES: GNAT family N-acetyltransferase [unclassified Streptomyces]MYS18767.1 GNAT family N-acetyltransferase [Streptomyces sp. SID4948]SCD28923.1 Acetyltransferase (GNAT) domain-containing protein [Streptomyces sp. DvalAA-14]
MTATLTTWYLELGAPGELRPAPAPAPAAGVRIVRAEIPSGVFGRFLYTAVGGDCSWTDRLPWPPEQWQRLMEQPGHEVWVAYRHGTPAGYLELAAQDEGAVEIEYFGLLPQSRGLGIGGHLLSYGTARAWDLADRWPGRAATRRVWLHTCSLDGPHALANYRRRGFRVTHTTTSQMVG